MASRIPVSLSEILEVRCGGLGEEEAWSVLGQCLAPLERLIENAKFSSVGFAGFSSDSVFFLFDGSVQLKPLPYHSLRDSPLLLPPEYGKLNDSEIGNDSISANIDLDKAFVYALGAVINYAMKWDTMGSASSSPELYSVLNLMTLPEPSARLPLAKIAQIVQNQLQQRRIDPVAGIQNLYRLIMGSSDDVSDLRAYVEVTPPPQTVLVVDTAISPMSLSAADPIVSDPLSETWEGRDAGDSPPAKWSPTRNHADHGDNDIDLFLPSEKIDQWEQADPLEKIDPDMKIDALEKSNPFEEIDQLDQMVETTNEKPFITPPLETLKYEDGCGKLSEDDQWPHTRTDETLATLPAVKIESTDTLSALYKQLQDDSLENHEEGDVAWPSDNHGLMDSPGNKENDLLLLEIESPPGHSTAIECPTENDGKNPFDLHSSIDSSSQSPSKQQWVSFDSDRGPGRDRSEWTDRGEKSSSLDGLEQTASDFTLMRQGDFPVSNAASSCTLSAFEEQHEQPTFDQDPFSFYEGTAKPAAARTVLENVDLQLAFASDPTSPEKTDRSTKSGPKLASISSGKLKIFDELMPTNPAEFTSPKDHGEFVRVRGYHSINCGYCSPRRETTNETATQRNGSLQEMAKSTMGTPFLMVNTGNEKLDTRKEFAFALPLLSPHRDNDSLFASFDKLSSTATETSSADQLSVKKEPKTSPVFDKPLLPLSVGSLHYDANTGMVSPMAVDSEGDVNGEPETVAPLVDLDPAPVIPPPRPPRKFDVSPAEPILEQKPVQKVELYTRKSNLPTASASAPAIRGGTSEEKLHVPVLGVQRALALHRREQRQVAPSDDQQPSTSGQGQTSAAEVAHTNPAPTTSGQSAKGEEDRPVNNVYRNPSFVRDSFSRSARRHPLTARQKLDHQQSVISNGNVTMATNGVGPEFIYKSRLPCIRLKAPSAKRKKLFRSSPDAVVHVILLNGQRVDVECHVDSTADDVFQAVSTHTNVMESHFFGLTYLRDSEHFFLEPEEKLAKFAPPGWRTANNRDITSSRTVYTLFFRLKFYPVSLDFVKTDQTLHQIYLQLRRDVIDERLQCGRESAYTLAAIALQAEYGDRPTDPLNYFQAEYYLPDPSTIEGVGGENRVRGLLAELHSQYAGLRESDAEVEFVRTCQMAREYGIHFHRIYRTKPSLLLTPSPLGDPDTGTPLWIGIMPRGVVIFEERAGERVAVSQHPWHTTHTLQFDHKRFVIVPQVPDTADRNVPRRLVFFTDNYRKSCYFVRFAAAQHRFCMRMRFWASTLPMEEPNGARATSSLDRRPATTKNNGSGLQVPSNVDSIMSNRSSETDSGISREASPEGREVYVGGEVHRERPVDAVLAPVRAPLTPRAQLRSGTLGAVSGKIGSESGAAACFPSSPSGNGKIDISIPSHDASGFFSFNETFSESMEKRLENATDTAPSLSPSDYEKFTIKLCKDPQTGLGLTLVDGEIQGLKGVYVKVLTPGGPAELEGRLRTGDKIISINGCDLDLKTRHDAVQLVRSAIGEVEIGILRLKSLYSSNESIGSGMASTEIGRSLHDSPKHVSPLDERGPTHLGADIVQARPTHGDHKPSGKVSRQHLKKEETVDFEKFGVTLDLDEFLEKDYRAGGVRFTPNYGAQMYAGLGGDTDEEEKSDDGCVSEHSEGRPLPADKTTRPAKNASSEEEADHAAGEHSTFGDGSYLKIDKTSKSHGDLVAETDAMDKSDGVGPKYSGSRGDIDWTNDLINSRVSSMDSIDDQPNENLQAVDVVLEKNEHGSLGIQVAGGKGAKKVYVKALVAEPALSCPDILPGDQLASVNGVSTITMAHSDVVSLLKNATSPVQLGLLRAVSSANGGYGISRQVVESAKIEAGRITETFDVTLEKPSSGSLGLSLAKPRTGAGIYVRFINPNSVAALDGRLKEGDRLWKINGELVAQSTPEEVVEKLKAAHGYIHLVIRRDVVTQ